MFPVQRPVRLPDRRDPVEHADHHGQRATCRNGEFKRQGKRLLPASVLDAHLREDRQSTGVPGGRAEGRRHGALRLLRAVGSGAFTICCGISNSQVEMSYAQKNKQKLDKVCKDCWANAVK